MRVLVWGLGYVGTVTAACLAHLGHYVVGVETNPFKVAAINAGYSAVREPGLNDLICDNVRTGRLKASVDGKPYVSETDLSLICVGTPSGADGRPNLDHLRNVAHDLGVALRAANNYHVVVIRSTVFPGTLRDVLLPILEDRSDRKAGPDFGLASNPEFLRETTAIADFHSPSYTLIGGIDTQAGDVVEELYRGIRAPVYRVAPEEAEILKLVNNSFHALKIGFANEVGRVCDRLGIDSHNVMEMVTADTKLNISPAYLKPGFAFGGSCLPKDLRALVANSRQLGLELPILEGVLSSNRIQNEMVRQKVADLGARKVGILGLGFKPGSDDLRESPIVTLVRDLWQDGFDVLVHDPDIQPEIMLGSNREYMERQLPQIKQILRPSIQDVVSDSEVIIVCQKRPEFRAAVENLDGRVAVLDLVRMTAERKLANTSRYQGISW